jgi:DNA invertase Pin-like site-specific DNA recombinase
VVSLRDQEMVYAPRQGNDRLLLGLQGSLNEYELDPLGQRSLSARYEKAQRGELIVRAPSRLREGGRPSGEGWHNRVCAIRLHRCSASRAA